MPNKDNVFPDDMIDDQGGELPIELCNSHRPCCTRGPRAGNKASGSLRSATHQ
jgi:hypothetical protein